MSDKLLQLSDLLNRNHPATLFVDDQIVATGHATFYRHPDGGKFWPNAPAQLDNPCQTANLILTETSQELLIKDVKNCPGNSLHWSFLL